MYGYAAGEIIGRDAGVLIPEELREEELATHRRACETGEASETCTERVRKDGSRIPVVLQLSPALDGHGQVWRLAHISRRIR